MSDLLNKASLVMVPSGYKEDTVYSVVPTDGSGDLSFTRSSNGTRVNSAGLVEVCPWNLVQWSEDFTNTAWVKDSATITSNSTTAPNGTTTADTWTIVADPSFIYATTAYSLASGSYTFSIYAKKNASSNLRMDLVTSGFSEGAVVTFNLNNGTAGAVSQYGSANGFVATITAVGNDWYRCSLGGNVIAGNYNTQMYIGSGSIFIYGAQLNIGSTAKPYFPTTDRLNVPRLTYQNGGGGCPSLLLEKQSTNLFIRSEQFDDASWVKTTGSVTANQAISPDGTQNADLIAGEIYQQRTQANSTTYSFSVFAKKESGTTVYIGYIDNVTGFVGGSINYTYSTGVISVTQSANGSVSGEAIDMGNGWIRVIIKYTTIALVTFNYQYIGSVGSYIWGAQLEASTYPTSYIPTTSSSATRVADVMTVNLPNTNMTFTAYLECEEAPLGTTATDWLQIYNNSSILGRAYGYDNVFGFADAYSLGVASGTKMVWKQESGSTAKIFKGGALVGTSTTGTYSNPFNRFRIDAGYLDKPVKIKQFVFFDNALTDAECIQLTA